MSMDKLPKIGSLTEVEKGISRLIPVQKWVELVL
jgi:hypothetical protein